MQTLSSDAPRIYGGQVAPCVLIEPARTNLIPRSEGTVSQLSTGGDGGTVTDAGVGLVFDNFIKVSRGTQTTYAYYGPSVNASTTYAVSCFCYVSDGAKPSFGNSGTDDARLILAGNALTTYTYQQITANLWRVSAVGTTSASPGSTVGITKLTSHTAKDLYITGFQMEVGAWPTTYIKSNAGSTASRAVEVYTADGAAPYLKGQAFCFQLGIYRNGYTGSSPRPVFIEFATSGVSNSVPRWNVGVNSANQLSCGGMQNDGTTVLAAQVIAQAKTSGWDLVCGNVKGDGTVDLYVNGVFVLNMSFPTNLLSSLSNIRIGGGCAFNGWEASTHLAPGAPALGIKFLDAGNLTAQEVYDMHQKWLIELNRNPVPIL